MHLSNLLSKSVIKGLSSSQVISAVRQLSSKSLKLEPNVEQIDDSGKITTQNDQRRGVRVVSHLKIFFAE
jgi:hypothetical protein